MPWTHCERELEDDTTACPTCGVTKQTWTVDFQVTREFKVRRRKAVRLEVLGPSDLPAEGLAYEVQLPEGALAQGALDELGTARVHANADGEATVRFPGLRRGDLAIEGQEATTPDAPAELPCAVGARLRARLRLARARWSVEEARQGDPIDLAVDAGLPDGTQVRFQVLEHDADGAHDPVEELSGEVSAGVATASWTWQDVADEDDVATSEEEEAGGYTVPEFFFRAEAEGARAESGLVRHRGWFELHLKDHDGAPRVAVEVRLTCADDSTLTVSTDDEGVARFDHLPPGEVSWEFDDVVEEDDPAYGPSAS